MSTDPNPIHPELRPLLKWFPRFPSHRSMLWLIRLLSNLQPVKSPSDVKIKTVAIAGQDPQRTILLRIYTPETMAAPAPALLWMHGGGYVVGRPKMNDVVMVMFARELGIPVVSVDYRLAPEHPFPASLEDCYTALTWVNANSQWLGVDARRIAVGGESAGSGLAAALSQLALDRGAVQPVFQVLVYPMLDDRSANRADLKPEMLKRLTWTLKNNRLGWHSYLRQPPGLERVPPYAVPARRDDLRGLPPAWIGVGTLDLFHDEAVAYAERLKECGVDCELVIVPGAFHGFDIFGMRLTVVADFRRSQVDALRRALFDS